MIRRLGYSLLAISIAIAHMLYGTSLVRSATPATLVQQGKIAYERGHFPTALTIWERAEVAYRQDRDLVGVTGSQVNQARALIEMGLNRRACKLLVQTVQVSADSCEASIPKQFGIRQTNLAPGLQVLALNTLGDVLRRLGNFDAAWLTLVTAGEIAKPLSAEAKSPILVNIAHTFRDLGNRDLQLTNVLEPPTDAPIACPTQFAGNLPAAASYQRSIACYRQADNLTAQIDRFSLELEISHWLKHRDLTEIAGTWQHQFNHLNAIDKITKLLSREPYTHQSLNQRINFARSLGLADRPQWQLARELLNDVITQSRLLDLKSVLTNATGTLGWLYERDRQWSQALSFTDRALALATTPDRDTRYQWEWQLGRILQHQSQPDFIKSQAAYDRAITALEQTRRHLRAIDPAAQFSLRDRIEPLYRESIDLNLRIKNPDLTQIIDRVDALKLAELENFLQCQLGEYRSVNEFAEDSGAVVFYPIILADRLEVILRSAQHKFQRFVVPVGRLQLEQTISRFQQSLTQPQYGWNSTAAAQLYDWLIRPAQPYLSPQTKNLVFVMDGVLQNIPVAALYDRSRQEYLIDRYPVSVTPGLKILGAQQVVSGHQEISIGGLTTKSVVGDSLERSIGHNIRRGDLYEPLTYVATEIREIKSLFSRSTELVGQNFTPENIRRVLTDRPHSIVHLATHGQFSADPRQTFIVTAAGKLLDLNSLRSIFTQHRSGIDLMVLSACETAAGDRHAALGLAGMAIRSGAASTLASMWSVDDRATSKLMHKFYATLTQRERVSKAAALQIAQRKIRQDYEHPYYWASFVLVGNWL
jgi:CHAT domain-containing protein